MFTSRGALGRAVTVVGVVVLFLTLTTVAGVVKPPAASLVVPEATLASSSSALLLHARASGGAKTTATASLRVVNDGDDSDEGGSSGGDATTGDDGEAGEVTTRMPTGLSLGFLLVIMAILVLASFAVVWGCHICCSCFGGAFQTVMDSLEFQLGNRNRNREYSRSRSNRYAPVPAANQAGLDDVVIELN
ncbi:hypothetical protein SCHPADRAFT_927700 [Schizopora paradoxa]|uniref:Uncharacterized protein n=1 Tax=Schizopora paradoxa TaxID=27342 RepID=A0A0H2RRN9_9AGAM|nr:hypothetical protein SCHPADRAFT_927700 [Schizopora paradoxa]